MPTGVLLMHTLLAFMSLCLFVVLQLARSQGAGDNQSTSEVLQRLNALDVLSMALLDTLRSLLALEGATGISGITQTQLLQVSSHLPSAYRPHANTNTFRLLLV